MCDEDPLSPLEMLVLEDHVVKWDEILIVRPQGGVPFSTNGPVSFAEDSTTQEGIGVVQSVQDETGVEAGRVIVCQTNSFWRHTSIDSDEYRRLDPMLRVGGRGAACQ